MTDILYERIETPNGRVKYVPAGVRRYDVLPPGAHLVIVTPGCTSTRYNVHPDLVGFLAAANTARAAMLDAMRAADTPEPESTNPEQDRKAWQAYRAAGGGAHTVFRHRSPDAVVEAGILAVLAEFQKGVGP